MLNVQDYELSKPPDPPDPSRHRRPVTVWVAIALLAAGIAAAAYIVFGWRRGSTPQDTSVAVGTTHQPVPPAQPLGGEAAPIDLPPLGETDAVVRELVKGLSSHPTVAAWLATDNLIRNFTVVVANIAESRSPSSHLTVLRPSAPFRVVEQGEDLYIDPRSYERYSGIAAAAASIDPQGSATLYATLKPRIEEAYRELGVPDTPFDRTLERAIVVLLSTPVPGDRVLVEPEGVGYAFANPDMEALTPPQKQLLRMGPRNARLVQSSLREIALALGIPAERLPAPR
jgi:hypothetical protein